MTTDEDTSLNISRRRLLAGTACCALGGLLPVHAAATPGAAASIPAGDEEFVIVNGWVLLPGDLRA